MQQAHQSQDRIQKIEAALDAIKTAPRFEEVVKEYDRLCSYMPWGADDSSERVAFVLVAYGIVSARDTRQMGDIAQLCSDLLKDEVV